MLDVCNAIALIGCINIGQRPFQYVGWGRREAISTIGLLPQVVELPNLTLGIKHKVTSHQTLIHILLFFLSSL